MARNLSKFTFFIGTLLFSGCVPLGLPEYVAGMSGVSEATGNSSPRSRARHSRLPAVLLVSPASQSNSDNREEEVDSRENLGVQYVLGIVPFTRVFLEHGSDRLVHEISIDVLEQMGFNPLETSPDAVQLASAISSPVFVVQTNLEGLSANAYDLLFLRLISVGGELSVSLRNSVEIEAPPQWYVRKKLDRTKARKYAHGQLLGSFVVKEVKEKLVSAFSEGVRSMENLRRKRIRPKSANGRIVVLARPRVGAQPNKVLGQLFKESYGYSSEPNYPRRSISRVVQRGVQMGLAAEGLPYLSETGTLAVVNSVSPHSGSRVWKLEVVVQQAAFTEDEVLELKLVISLRDLQDSQLTVLERKGCITSASQPNSKDGAAVFAAEAAVSEAISVYFSEKSSETAKCG